MKRKEIQNKVSPPVTDYDIQKEVKPKEVDFRKRKGTRVIWRGTVCTICGKPLNVNNPEQSIRFCSRKCRAKRHNRKVEK